MEELIQRQLRQRELDIPTIDYSGSFVPSYVPDISTSLTAQNSSEKTLSIHPEIVRINVLDISQTLQVQKPSNKKNVVFDLPNSESQSMILDPLFNKMNQLEEKIDKLMNMVSAYIPKDDAVNVVEASRIFRNINKLFLEEDEDEYPIL